VPYVAAFGLTLLVELPVYAFALGRGVLIRAAVANLVTHPALWLALGAAPSTGAFVLAELLAWTVEFGLLLAWLRREPLTIAAATVLANALSCLAGLLLSR
jgi:hypothetical protein